MTTLGLNHYNLRANRELLDALRDFYCTVVGLTVGERPPFSSFGYWLYAGDQEGRVAAVVVPTLPGGRP